MSQSEQSVRRPPPNPSSSASASVSQVPQLQSSQPETSSLLLRRASDSSQPSGRIPSPRPPVQPSSKPSFTPKLLSRQSSIKDKTSSLLRRTSGKGKEAELASASVPGSVLSHDEGWKSPMSESSSVEVIETQAARVQRDLESGRWMINQYKVLREIGHGTHGRVRLGEDLSVEMSGAEDGDMGLGINPGGPYYAIKIVDRNPKKKRLTGLGRQKGMKTGRDGAKLLNESEIRKEIAIFKKVNHPNVVRMKEIIDDPDSSKIYMILEWCENGEIKWKEDEGQPALTVGETRKVFRDTLLGLEYLHHQGIIHRDIKPSNLLRAADGTVKISDFGCSHFSEALAAAQSEGDAYVDDIELAKTAGSPAFFAPEMCYSGLDTEMTLRSSSSPQTSPMNELPAFTLRPPSMVETRSSQSDPTVSPASHPNPLKPTLSNDSALSQRPHSSRSYSSVTIQRRERLAITNAIDVWALGVTLYCLFFGKTPFDAPNEYLLMQVIPTQQYVVPPFMGKDHIPTGAGGLPANDESEECLHLLQRLLEKDPSQRITLEQAKKHPFTLRGLADPIAWLAKTDPHHQTFVTVSSDEVAAVITKSVGFKDRFRRGIKTISNKLQILGGAGRNRSRSIGDTESPNQTNLSSMAASQVSLLNTPRSSKITPRLASASGDPSSPMFSPLPPPVSLTRRLSIFGSKSTEHPPPSHTGPAPSSAHVSGHVSSELEGTPRAPPGRSGFVVHRQTSTHLVPPVRPNMVPLADEAPRSPRPVASSSSLDKVRSAGPDFSPSSSVINRRGSSEVDMNRRRSASNASSISSRLVRILRSGSQRSRRVAQDKEQLATSQSDMDNDEAAPSAGSVSPVDAMGRMSLDEGLPRQSFEGIEWGSYSSRGEIPHSPDRLPTWDRFRPNATRRGSIPSEDIHGDDEGELEQVDWTGDISDEDDYEESSRPGLPPSAPNFTPNWRRSREGLGLDQSVQARPTLEPIPDGSPAQSNMPAPRPSPLSIPNPNEIYRTSSRASTSSRLSSSPFRTTFTGERARSPLGFGENPSPMRLNLSRQTSASVLADDDDDEGLAISVGGKRTRKGSMLGRAPIILPESDSGASG